MWKNCEIIVKNAEKMHNNAEWCGELCFKNVNFWPRPIREVINNFILMLDYRDSILFLPKISLSKLILID
jgi:hypothetical protein